MFRPIMDALSDLARLRVEMADAEPDPDPDAVTLRSLAPRMVAFDFETTGIDVQTAAIVQVAVAPAVGEGGWQALAWPDNATGWPQVPPGAAKIHGIDDARLLASGAVEALDLLRGMWEAVTGLVEGVNGPPIMVAYNGLVYDVPLLHAVEARVFGATGAGDPQHPDRMPLSSFVNADSTIDPFVVASALFREEVPSMSLGALYGAIFGEPLKAAHDAMADVRGTLRVLWAMVERFESSPDLWPLAQVSWWMRAQEAAAALVHAESELFGPWLRMCVETGEVVWRMKRRSGERLNPSDACHMGDLEFASRKSVQRREHRGMPLTWAVAKMTRDRKRLTVADLQTVADDLRASTPTHPMIAPNRAKGATQ